MCSDGSQGSTVATIALMMLAYRYDVTAIEEGGRRKGQCRIRSRYPPENEVVLKSLQQTHNQNKKQELLTNVYNSCYTKPARLVYIVLQ